MIGTVTTYVARHGSKQRNVLARGERVVSSCAPVACDEFDDSQDHGGGQNPPSYYNYFLIFAPCGACDQVCGIMNGTTNFMLSKMESEGANYGDVLKEAQDLGYAEGETKRRTLTLSRPPSRASRVFFFSRLARLPTNIPILQTCSCSCSGPHGGRGGLRRAGEDRSSHQAGVRRYRVV